MSGWFKRVVQDVLANKCADKVRKLNRYGVASVLDHLHACVTDVGGHNCRRLRAHEGVIRSVNYKGRSDDLVQL